MRFVFTQLYFRISRSFTEGSNFFACRSFRSQSYPATMSVGRTFFCLIVSVMHWLISATEDDIQTESLSLSLNVTLQPKDGVRMMVGHSATVNISFQFNEAQHFNDSLFVFVRIEDAAVADFNGSCNASSSSSVGVPLASPSEAGHAFVSVQLTGRRLGITSMAVSLGDHAEAPLPGTQKRRTIASEYSVRVTKTASPLNRGLRLGTMGAMAVNFMTFGCKLRYEDMKKYAKQPFGILIGFLLQFGLMPTITYLLGLVAGLKTHFAFALFAVGCAPGGGPSNLCTVILRGDLHMSIIMTFISTVGALGMIPLWMFTLGRVVLKTGYPASEVQMPWALLVIAVLWFSVPTVVGMVVASFLPRLATVFVVIVRPVAFVFLLVQVAVFIYFNYPVIYFADTWQLLAVTAATPYIAFALSFALALLVFRRSTADAVTIMIETGIQNITFAYFLIVATLPQPDGDISSVVPLLVIFFTYGPILFVVFPLAAVVSRMRNRRKAQGYTLTGVGEKEGIGEVKGKVTGRRLVSSETQLAGAGSEVSLESIMPSSSSSSFSSGNHYPDGDKWSTTDGATGETLRSRDAMI